MEWSIQHIAELTGVTSRTLRHYDSIGLLTPARVASNGYRYYDERSLVRLQRILLLRELGLGLPVIAEVLDGNVDDIRALQDHLHWLECESNRIQTQIRSVHNTMQALQKGEELMAETMFGGFDYTQYHDEVKQRWGQETAESSATWWKGLRESGQQNFLAQHRALQDAYDEALSRGQDPKGADVQEIASKHYDWLVESWQGRHPDAAALKGLADMYVADPRFAQNYTRTDPQGAEFVLSALYAYAEQHLRGEG